MPTRDLRLMLVLALLSAVGLMAEAAGVLAPTLLYLAPLLLIVLPLLAGRYVGEDRIERLARSAGRRRRVSTPRPAAPPAALRAIRVLPRGGRLIAVSLAVRPPPAPAFR